MEIGAGRGMGWYAGDARWRRGYMRHRYGYIPVALGHHKGPGLAGRLHEFPAASFGLVGVVGGVVGVTVAAVAVGPVVLVVGGVLGRAVVGVVGGVDAADVVIEVVVGAACGGPS